MSKPAKNTSSGPVVIDDDGHSIGGGEWGTVDPDSDRVQDLVDAGLLVIKDEAPKSANSAAPGEPVGADAPASAGSKAARPKETT